MDLHNEKPADSSITVRIQEPTETIKQNESEIKQYQCLSNFVRDIVLFVHNNGQIIGANNAAVRAYGFTRKELLSMSIYQLLQDDPLIVDAQIEKAKADGTLVETFHHRKDGSIFPVEVNSMGVSIDSEVVVFSIIRDITERKHAEALLKENRQQLEEMVEERTNQLLAANEKLQREITERNWAEQALRESEERYRIIFENTGSATAIIDENTTISLANAEFVKLIGFSKHTIEGKKSWVEFVHKDDLERLMEYHRFRRTNPNAAPGSYEFQFIDRQGDVRNALATVAMLPGTRMSVASILDITEYRKLENEILRLDRLNLVGEMAAGIGHEIRNPMTTVRGFLQLLGGKSDCAQFRDFFNLMIEELDRANSIITEFLSLAKNKAVKKKVNNINTILEALLPLMKTDAFKSDKYIIAEMGAVPDLLLDEKEIRQLILNLAHNALEAVSHGGSVKLKTFMERDEVVLAVTDHGTGIEPEVLKKLGTPFFTTKDYGTGLGLAVCYSVASRHNGIIEVETSSTGTTFFVRFKSN